jgi:hypothetical protein
MSKPVYRRAAAAFVLLPALTGITLAADAVLPAEGLDTITVSATRLRSVPDFDVPATPTTAARTSVCPSP